MTRKGWITLNFPDREPDDLPVSCALDVADSDGAELNEVAQAMNISRGAVLALQARAVEKVREQIQ